MIFHIEFKEFLEVLFKEYTIFKDDIPHWIQTVFRRFMWRNILFLKTIFHIEFKQFLEVLFKEHTIFKDDSIPMKNLFNKREIKHLKNKF